MQKAMLWGKKDIIKVEGLLDIDLDVLGFIDCDITVNVIDDGKIIEKKKLTMPNHTQCGILQKSTLYHFH